MRPIRTLATAALAMMLCTPTMAGDFTVTGSTDVVSRYVWRGMEQGAGASLQPTLELGYAGFTAGAWGSTSLASLEPKEFDVYLGYSIGGLSATLTDYFWAGESMGYGYYKTDHFFELALSYSFGEDLPLTLGWATMLFGGESTELDEDGNRMFSTYISASYDFDISGVTLTPAIGITPWKGQFSDKFDVMDITLTASKDIEITEKFSLPVFTQVVVSPACDRTYLIAGCTIGF